LQQNAAWSSLAAFLSELPSEDWRTLVTAATAQDKPMPNPAQQLSDVTLRLRNQYLDRQIAPLLLRASQPECGEAEKLELLRQQQELRALKRQPLGPLHG
jgi:hypothetical protein